MNEPRRAAVYRRVSGENDERTASLDEQAERAASKARAAGYECDPGVDVFEDHFSGFYLSERQGLAALREAIRGGRYGAVAVFALDRLSRNMGHTAILFSEFTDHEVEVISATEEVESTPEGQLLTFIRSYFAQIERAKISERTRMGRRQRIARGLIPQNGPPLYGYRYHDGRRVEDDVSGPVVRMIYELAASGWSSRRIAGHLTTTGVRPPAAHVAWRLGKAPKAGGAWSSTKVQHILTDPSYLGRTFIGRYAQVDRSRKNKKPVQFDRLPIEGWTEMAGDLTEPLIDEDRWHLVQSLVGARSDKMATTRNGRDFWLLRGMVFCSRCGANCYSSSTKYERGEASNRYRYYTCSARSPKTCHGRERQRCTAGRVRANWIERVAWEKLSAILVEPDQLDRAIERLASDGTASQIAADLERAERSLSQATGDQEVLYQAYTDALRSRNDRLAARLKADWQQADEAVRAHQETVDEYRTRLAARTDRRAIMSRLRSRIDAVRRGIESGEVTDQQKRDALEAFGTRIEADGDSVHIRFEVADPEDLESRSRVVLTVIETAKRTRST